MSDAVFIGEVERCEVNMSICARTRIGLLKKSRVMSHTFLGVNPYVPGDLFARSLLQALDVLLLQCLFFLLRPGKSSLIHARCADEAVTCASLLSHFSLHLIIRQCAIARAGCPRTIKK